MPDTNELTMRFCLRNAEHVCHMHTVYAEDVKRNFVNEICANGNHNGMKRTVKILSVRFF
jgi:hypothetical protein